MFVVCMERPDDAPEPGRHKVMYGRINAKGCFTFEEVAVDEVCAGWPSSGGWSHTAPQLLCTRGTVGVTISGGGSRLRGRLVLPEDAKFEPAWGVSAPISTSRAMSGEARLRIAALSE